MLGEYTVGDNEDFDVVGCIVIIVGDNEVICTKVGEEGSWNNVV